MSGEPNGGRQAPKTSLPDGRQCQHMSTRVDTFLLKTEPKHSKCVDRCQHVSTLTPTVDILAHLKEGDSYGAKQGRTPA